MTATLQQRQIPPTPTTVRRIWWIAIAAAALAVLITVVVLASRPSTRSTQAITAHTVSAPIGAVRAASIDLVSGAPSVTVRSADLGADLYRISTPVGADPIPQVTTVDGSAVTISLVGSGSGGPGPVELLLSNRVTWQVRLSGGATTVRMDLRGGPVTLIDLASGVSTADLWLPDPAGTSVVSENGGLSTLALHAPARVPVQVAVDGGAGSAVLDGVTHAGIAGGSTFAPANWAQATDRYDVRLVGGVSQVTLDRSAP